MDPLVDKIMVAAAFISLVPLKAVPAWAAHALRLISRGSLQCRNPNRCEMRIVIDIQRQGSSDPYRQIAVCIH